MSSETGIGRKTIFIFLIKLTLTVIAWLGLFYVARYMGSETWGMIGFAVGLGAVFFQSDFGFGLAHNKKISEGHDVGECLGAYIQIKIVLTLALLSVLVLAFFIWEELLGFGYEDPILTTIVAIIMIYYIMFTISQVPIQTFGGLRQSVKQQMPEFFGTVIRSVIMIMIAVMALGVIWLAYSYVISGIVMVFIAFLLLRKFKIKKPSKELRKSYILFATPLAIYVFFSNVSLHLDKIVLQLFWDFTEVGNFFMMQKFIMVITIITSSLGPIFFPSISFYHTRNKMKIVRHLMRKAERYMSMIITPIVAILIPLAVPTIIILVGNDFLGGADALVWLSIYALILSLNVPHMHLINGCGRSDLLAKVGLTIAITNIILLFVLVPRSIFGYELFGLGSMGAAMSSTFSVSLGFILSRRYSRQVAGVRANNKIYKHWIAGFLTSASIYLFNENILSVQRWYELIIVSAMGLLIYIGILVALGEFKKKDWNFFIDLLNPKKMGKYIGGELRS